MLELNRRHKVATDISFLVGTQTVRRDNKKTVVRIPRNISH